MLTRKYIMLVIVICFVIIPLISDAANLRGRVEGRNQYSGAPYPIGGAAVALFNQGPGGWRLVAKYITGLDGMYFFKTFYQDTMSSKLMTGKIIRLQYSINLIKMCLLLLFSTKKALVLAYFFAQ